MKNLITAGRIFYALGIAGIGAQQFIYKDFRPVLVPQWPAWIPAITAWAYLGGAGLVCAALIIIFSNNAITTTRILGLVFLLFFMVFHITFQFFVSPYSFHLGLWTDALKELSLSGGAFIIAASYTRGGSYQNNSFRTRLTGILLNLGLIFFSITMIVFGIDHFLYPEFVSMLVPRWIPGPTFWTYFAAVALIGSGAAILLRINRKLVAMLLGIMLFLWLIVLHIPRAVSDPYSAKGNEVTSVFEALAFSGIAFIIACMPFRKFMKR